MNAWQLMVSAKFPIDLLVTLGMGALSGFAWALGAKFLEKLL